MQEMAAAYRGPHRIILNRNPTNLGHARHVERIMEISSGAFIVESAGDDISLPERTERLVAAWLASGRRAHAVHSEKQDIDADRREDGLRAAHRHPGRHHAVADAAAAARR